MSAASLEAWLEGFLTESAFVARYPHYAAVLSKIKPVADPSVFRMAVSLEDGRFYLHVNVESFLAEPQYLRGVLLHEVHHVVLGHLTHPKFADPEVPELMDLAIEMSANEYIEEPLPRPIVWQPYAAFGLKAGQSTLERYELLLQHHRKTGAAPRPSRTGEPPEVTDDHRFLGRGDDAPGGVVQTAMLISSAVEEAKRSRGEDGDAAKEPIPGLFAGRSAGRLIEELFDTTVAPEEAIDFRAALPLFVARARAPVHTWSRPSRRFPQRIFEVPGRRWAPNRSEDVNLLVAIDTSMSMTRGELEEIARQLVPLSERTRITVVECDTEVTRVYPFTGRLDDVAGRGGTDLRPVFEAELLGSLDVDGVVYFTDGLGPVPEEPAMVPTLWVLTKPDAFACTWGERAFMPRVQRLASAPQAKPKPKPRAK